MNTDFKPLMMMDTDAGVELNVDFIFLNRLPTLKKDPPTGRINEKPRIFLTTEYTEYSEFFVTSVLSRTSQSRGASPFTRFVLFVKFVVY